MKKIKFLIIFIFLGALIWYLFFKPYDYMVRFKVKTSPGTVFVGVEDWNIFNQKLDSFTYKINDKKPYTFINETLNINEMNLELVWNFKSINDSTTHVTVGVTEKKNSIYNRIKIPFFDTKIEKIVVNTVKKFKAGIENQIDKKLNVKFIGIDTIPEIAYAYVEFKNIEMRNKAKKMMEYDVSFLQFINLNKLKGGEYPFLIINKWDLNKSKIDFRYCFPIKLKDSMPFHQYIKFDVIKPKKVLKALYYGNYKTSDRGWFAIHEYAKRHDIAIENNPIEFFYHNPHNGGNELKWKAVVYMPIKNKAQ